MAKERDLTQPTNPVAPPAMPIQGMPMIPPGELISANKFTDGEKALLDQAGWKEGDPIPANFAELNEQAKAIAAEATNIATMPPPGDMNTPALELPEEQDLNKMSPEQQQRYQMVMQSVLGQAESMRQPEPEIEGADPSVLAAIRAAGAESPQLVKDSPAAAAAAEKPTEEVVDGLCARCGWPKSLEDSIEVTEPDKDVFLSSVLGGKAFEKLYDLFGGRMQISCRTLAPHEVDLCWKQVHADFKNGLVQTPQDQADRLQRYRAALQVTSIDGDSPVTVPKSMAEWETLFVNDVADLDSGNTVIQLVWKRFSQLLTNESLHRLIVGTVGDFNNLVAKLEASANSPDFWTAADA